MKKALLMICGGRSMPNVLTIIHEKPDIIVPIISESVQLTVPSLESSIAKLFEETGHAYDLDTSFVVKPFDVEDVKAKCIQAVMDRPNLNWIFNITSATTLMSIGAYEAAKELRFRGESVRCWYLNTAQTHVVPVLGEGRDEKIFHIEVEQYATVYNCRLAPGILEDQRQYCQNHWVPFTKLLVSHPHYIDLLKEVLKHIQPRPAKPSKGVGSRKYSIPLTTDETYMLLEEAYKVGLLDDLQRDGKILTIRLSYTQANFLDGPWLEVYVWDEALKLNIFSDCQWNQRIVDEKKPDDKDSKNEVDDSMIYHAQLLVAECKTGDDAFKSSTLYKLDSVTSLLGGRFVSKMLVTSLPIPDEKDRNKHSEYEDFRDRAHERSIVVVTTQQLAELGIIIEKQAKHPKHARI